MRYANVYASGSAKDLKLEKKGEEEIKFIKDEYGFVTAIQLRGKEYTGDKAPKADFIRYYESYDSNWRLFVMNDSRIIIIEQPGTNMRILGSLGGKAKKSDRKKILEYMEATEEIQKEDIARKAKEETLSQDEIDDVYAQVNKLWSQYDEICFWDYEDHVIDFDDPNVVEESAIIDENNKFKEVNLILEKDPVLGYEANIKELGLRVAYWKIRWIRVKKDGKYGFVNHKNQIQVPIKYDYLGRAFVKGLVKIKNAGKFGYMNDSGEEVVPCIYDNIHSFSSNGLAAVEKNGAHGFVNTEGKVVIPIIYASTAGEFHGNIVRVETQDGKKGYIKENGEIAIPLVYDMASRVNSCLYHTIVQVRQNGKYGFMARNSKEGEFVNRGLIYDKATLYQRVDSKGLYAYLAEVEKDGRSYYIDEHGYETDPESFIRVGSSLDAGKAEEESSNSAQNEITIVNDLSSNQQTKYNNVELVFSGGRIARTTVMRGASIKVKCGTDAVYKAVKEGSSETRSSHKILDLDDYCGKTIRLSTIW